MGNYTPRHRRARKAPARRGSALVYILSTLVALMALASLAVDLGHVWVVRNELQLAADASARYGVTGLATGVTTAQNYCVDAANDNKADGTPVVIDPAADIEFLDWNKSTRTYTVLSGAARSNANALRVTARRTSANGNAVELLMARVIGRTRQDVRASSVAFIEDVLPAGIIGYSGIRVKNNAFFAAYNSTSNRNPSESTALATGKVLSNGLVFGETNNTLSGSVVLGPGAPNVAGIGVSGTVTRLAQALVPPDEVPWTPAPNPNGVPQNYTINGNVTAPGGTYWFTSLAVKGTLTFSGPATLTVNGPILVSGALRAYDLVPGNLRVNQRGTFDFGDDDINGADIVADVVAPGADFVAKNNLQVRGRLIVHSIEIQNNADVFYDVALGDSLITARHVVTVR